MGRSFLALAVNGRIAVIGLGTTWDARQLRWADDRTAAAITEACWADRWITTIRDLDAAIEDSRAEDTRWLLLLIDQSLQDVVRERWERAPAGLPSMAYVMSALP